MREALQTALAEIRAVSRGLSLPELDRLPLAQVARRAVDAHLRPAGRPIALSYSGDENPEVDEFHPDLPLPLPAGGPVQRRAPRARRRRPRPGRSRSRPADCDGGRRRPGLRSSACRRGSRATVARALPVSAIAPKASVASSGSILEPGAGTTAYPDTAARQRRDAMTIRTVLADDHPIFRDGLVRTLEESGAFTVLGAAGSADEAVALVEAHAPDLALARHLDARRRHGSGPPHPRRRAVDPDRDADRLGERPARRRRAAGRRHRLRAERCRGARADRDSRPASPAARRMSRPPWPPASSAISRPRRASRDATRSTASPAARRISSAASPAA